MSCILLRACLLRVSEVAWRARAAIGRVAQRQILAAPRPQVQVEKLPRAGEALALQPRLRLAEPVGGSTTEPVATGDGDTAVVEARKAHARRAWRSAYEAFARSDAQGALEPPDMEVFAECAAFLGQDDEFLALLERCDSSYLDTDAPLKAAQAAFWIGFRCIGRGEGARGSAWLERCRNLVEAQDEDHVLAGYLLLPVTLGKLLGGQLANAIGAADQAIAIGTRHAAPDVYAMAQNLKGRALLGLGRREEGHAPRTTGRFSNKRRY